MTAIPKPFKNQNLATGSKALPTANPGGGKPWIDPTTGAIIVGAMGTFGVSQAYVDAGLATKQAVLGYTPVNKAGDTMTGALSGTSFIASSALVGQNVLADYYLTTQANLSLRTSGVVKCQNVAGNADVGITAGSATLSGALTLNNAGFSGTTNYERGYQRWNSNVFEIGTEKGGTGLGRVLQMKVGGNSVFEATSDNIDFYKWLRVFGADVWFGQKLRVDGAATLSGPLYLAPITFATLPSASAQTGARYRITDRSQRECYSDGTNWRFAADDAIVT